MIVSVVSLTDFTDFTEIQKVVVMSIVLSLANVVAGLAVSYSSTG